jgi:predicted sulfurtransferase
MHDDKQGRMREKKDEKNDMYTQQQAEMMDNNGDDSSCEQTQVVNLEAAKSVAGGALPAIPEGQRLAATDDCDDVNNSNSVTICLCYQYKEPPWTAKQHRKVMGHIIQLADKLNITGRGRCAPEGLNCTLTSTNAQSMRDFCMALRDYDSIFMETDFKLEDGLDATKRFRSFSLRKTEELVNYGLGGAKAPSLQKHAGTHLEADAYHEAMKDKDAVIIDVRNRYESAIGHFQPPPNGATLLDPLMRNSSDFPKWLNAPETKLKLQNKKVLMYCTGGIRCERATALLNQMTQVEPTFQTKGDVVMVRGGIERYLKTYPQGGFWKGKNYLFDRRMEQVPSEKTSEQLLGDVESCCCLCDKPYASYLGQFKCSVQSCRVPVIVCSATSTGTTHCTKKATEQPHTLKCPLCVAGYKAPTALPDFSALGGPKKRQLLDDNKNKDGDGDDRANSAVTNNTESSTEPGATTVTPPKAPNTKRLKRLPSRRLFVGKLPLVITSSKLRTTLLEALKQEQASTGLAAFPVNPNRIEAVEWIVDRTSGAYYGSAWVNMARLEDAKTLEAKAKYEPSSKSSKSKKSSSKPSKQKQAGIVMGTATHNNTKNTTNEYDYESTSKSTSSKPRRIRMEFAPLHGDEVWPPRDHKDMEYPPFGSS